MTVYLPGILEAIHQVGAVAAGLADDYLACSGQWRLGLRVSGLQGLYPSQRYLENSFGSRYTPYLSATFSRTAVVTHEQLADPSY